MRLDQQRRLFERHRLTALGEGTQDTKRPIDRAELAGLHDDLDPVLHALAGARLIILADDTVSIAHEALFQAWPRLRGWLEDDRQGLRIQRQLTDATAIWEDLDHDPGALYRTTRLASALRWLRQTQPALTTRERDFLDHSIAAETATHRAAHRRRRALVAAVVVLLVVATAIAVPVVRQQHQQQRVELSRMLATKATGATAEAGRNSLLALDAHPTVEARGSLLSAAATSQRDHRQIPTPVSLLSGFALSPKGDLVATVVNDRLTVWNTASLAVVTTIAPSPYAQFAPTVAFSPDGATLAVGDLNGAITLWRLPDGTEAGTIDADPSVAFVLDVAFSSDGHTLVVNDGVSISLWDIAERRKLGSTETERHQSTLAVSADGRILATTGKSGTVDLWELPGLSHTAELPADGGEVLDLAFSPTGALLAVGNDMGGVMVWDAVTKSKVATAAPHPGATYGVAFSPDGTVLASTGQDGRLALWDVTERVPLPELPVKDEERPRTGAPASPRNVAFGSDGTLAVSTGSHILLWTADHLPRKFGDDVSDLAFGKDRLLELRDTGRLTTWATSGLRHVTDRGLVGTGADRVTGVFSADGTRLAVAAPGHPLSVWDTGGQDAVVLTTPGQPDLAAPRMMAVATDPSTVLVVEGYRERPFVLRDVRRPGDETVISEYSYLVTGAAFLRGSAFLALGFLDGDVRIRTVLTGGEVASLNGHAGPVTAIAPAQDGRMLATAGVDSTVILWDTGTWQQLSRLDGHASEVREAAMSPDGRMLATGSLDGTIILWDTTTRSLWATLSGNPGPVTALAWSPNSSMLASAGAHNTITLWPVDTDSAIRTVCDRLADTGGQDREPLPTNCPERR